MIGNDIIDLSLAKKESNWKRKGFLDKIFTSKEQNRIADVQNPELMVWNLWSRKEAAYKIYNRETQTRVFIPIKLECFDLEVRDGIIYGNVLCYDRIYYTKTLIYSECIESIAVLKESDFETVKDLKPDEVIIKINGIPNYYDIQSQTIKPLSKSHHGRFERTITL